MPVVEFYGLTAPPPSILNYVPVIGRGLYSWIFLYPHNLLISMNSVKLLLYSLVYSLITSPPP